MNPPHLDPDTKINMSLDDIIRLTRSTSNNNLRGGSFKTIKKKNRLFKKKTTNTSTSDHSIPILSSLGGGYIYVTKNSPLLISHRKRRMLQAISNRVMNSELLDKSKEIIPARYHIIKTPNGLERILVPADNRPQDCHRLRPLKKSKNNQINSRQSNKDNPPPLMNTLIYPPANEIQPKMEVDDPEDEIMILESDSPKKKPPVIDVESNLPLDVVEPAPLHQPQGVKSLNDRFTLLTGKLQF